MIIRVPKDQPTIQDAVNVANPGDTILVCPGVYTESVVIDTDRTNLLIKATGPNTVLRAPVAGLDVGFVNVFNDGVEIRGFTIKNFLVGIVDLGSSASTYADLCLQDNLAVGILLLFSKNTLISNVHICGSFVGLAAAVTKDVTVRHSEFEHNELGLTDILGSGIAVSHSELEANKLGGFLTAASIRSLLTDSKFTRNGPVLGGIFSIFDYANIYEHNIIACNGPGGFISVLTDENVLRRNKISNNDGAGVFLGGDDDDVVEFNCINRNRGAGIELFDTTGTTVRFNELCNNRGGNIVTSGGFDNVFDANQTCGL